MLSWTILLHLPKQLEPYFILVMNSCIHVFLILISCPRYLLASTSSLSSSVFRSCFFKVCHPFCAFSFVFQDQFLVSVFRPLSIDSSSEVGSENNAMSYANGRFDRTSSLVHIPMVSSSILINVKRFGDTGSPYLTPLPIFIF